MAHAEIIESERTLRQGEAFLIDTNMIQNLPPRVAVFFSDELPRFVGTSAVVVEKHHDAVMIEEASTVGAEPLAVNPFELDYEDE